jgi:hypothetical protein
VLQDVVGQILLESKDRLDLSSYKFHCNDSWVLGLYRTDFKDDEGLLPTAQDLPHKGEGTHTLWRQIKLGYK